MKQKVTKKHQELYKSLIKYFGGTVKTANALGVGQSTVSGYSKGSHYMGSDVARIAEHLTGNKFKAVDLSPKHKKAMDRLKSAA